MPQNPWNGSNTPSAPPLRRTVKVKDRAPRDATRTFLVTSGWLLGIPIAISAIYIAFPDLRILFYLSLIGAPLAILLDIIFSAAPYLIVIWGAAYLLNAFLPRLPGVIAILSPLLVVCGWLYFHANALNAERRAMADEAFALGESASTDRVDISRLALTASRTDCDLMCQKMLVSETVDQVLLFASPPENLSPEHLATTPVVVWRLGERTNCPTPRLSRSITSRVTEDDQDFAAYMQTLALTGRCIFEEPGTLDAATAILHRITVTDDTFHGRAVRVYSVNAGAFELAHASGGGTLLEVLYPPLRIRVPVGMSERIERAYMTRRVPYGANLEALSDETILGVIAGVDIQTMEFVYSDGQGFSRHSALLNAVRLADDPNNTALQQALIDYASAFSEEVDGQVYGDLELVLAVLRNPGSPVPPNLSQVVPPSEILPEGILNDIAEAAWVRIAAARDNEIGALGVFRALPDPIIASYRDTLFDFAARPIEQQSSVRVLARLLMFGEEGTLAFVNLLHRIAAEEDRVIANTIYGTVFGTLCDRTDLLQSTALRETIVSSIRSGQLDNYEWAHDRDVIGILAALNVEPEMIFELGNTHSAHYREDRTRRALDYVTRFQYCSKREE